MTTVRTIKLKRSNVGTEQVSFSKPDAPAAAPESGSATPSATPASAAPAPAAAADPAPQAVKGATVAGKSYLPYTIAASVVAVLFLVIMGLQYSEMAHYKAPPSVWVSPR